MTTTTNDGLEIVGDLIIGNVDAAIDAIAVGSGTGSEDDGATSLNNEKHRAPVSDSNVELIETGETGQSELIIRVKGGTEVDGGTPITEIGAFFNGAGGGGTLGFIDNFDAKVVEAGHTEEFTIPVDVQHV